MVGVIEVHNHEVNVVGAEVFGNAKLHREHDLPERYRALSRENTLELCIIGFKINLP
jgi:hypothetical protein